MLCQQKHAWKQSWTAKFPWADRDLAKQTVGCSYCMAVEPIYRGTDALSSGTQQLHTLECRYLSRHEDARALTGIRHHKNKLTWDMKHSSVAAAGPNTTAVVGVARQLNGRSVRVILCRILRTIFTIAKKCQAVSTLGDLCDMQELNGLMMGGEHYKSGSAAWGFVGLLSDWFAQAQAADMEGEPFAWQADGSTDRKRREQEIVYVQRKRKSDRQLVTEFWGLLTIDRKDSVDGTMCDAQAIWLSYMKSFRSRLKTFWDDEKNTIKETATTGASFDGASVMTGEHKGVTGIATRAVPHWITVHAVAHNFELAANDAAGHIAYTDEFNEILNGTYARYSMSPKRTDRVVEICDALDEGYLKLCNLHGIRWRAAQQRAIKALLKTLTPVALEHLKASQEAIGNTLSQLSPDHRFKQRKVQVEMEDAANRKRKYVGVVRDVGVTGTDGAGNHHGDYMTIYFSSSRTTMDMRKAEVATCIAEQVQAHAEESDEWLRYCQLRQYRFIVFASFMHDVQAELRQTSLVFQRGSETCLSDIEAELLRLTAQLERMLLGERGGEESHFYDVYDSEADMYYGLVCDEPEVGEVEFQKDRVEILTALIKHLAERFEKLLKNPILRAARVCFEQRQWPTADAGAMQSHGDGELNVLLRHYKAFFTIAECTHIRKDWQVFKEVMCTMPQILQLSESKFWMHVNAHFDYPHRHQLLIKLRTLVALIPLDTSECERGFSKMNLIMGSLRACLSAEHLDWLMRIALLGPNLKDFHPGPIIDRWIRNAKRGRQLGKLECHLQKVLGSSC